MEHKVQCSIKSMLKLHSVQTCIIYSPYEGDYTKIDQITASNICLLFPTIEHRVSKRIFDSLSLHSILISIQLLSCIHVYV